MIALIASLLLAVAEMPRPAFSEDSSAVEMIECCRRLLPEKAELSGRIQLVNRKGMVKKEFGYRLYREPAGTRLRVTGEDGAELPYEKEGPILGTDVTWSDLTLDYLWWDDFSFDPERKSDSVLGMNCAVLLLRKGSRSMRVWVSYRFGAMVQAEELEDGKVIRRLGAMRVKSFGDRQMASLLRVETTGSGHRTKITVEELK